MLLKNSLARPQMNRGSNTGISAAEQYYYRPATEDMQTKSGFVGGFNDDSAHVVATVWANHMSWNCSAAFRANRELTRFFRIMSSALAGSGVRVLSFGYCHDSALSATKGSVEFAKITISTDPCQPTSRLGQRPIPENWVLLSTQKPLSPHQSRLGTDAPAKWLFPDVAGNSWSPRRSRRVANCIDHDQIASNFNSGR